MFAIPTIHMKLNIDMFIAWRAEVIHHSSHYTQHSGLLVLLETSI
jgi:hypothetical protein